MEFRYHPIIENLKINEDGTKILFNGESMDIKAQKLPHTKVVRRIVNVNRKTVNTIRLVCEAWHGVAPTGEHAARRIDEKLGDHYSNLCWGKKGMTVSSVKEHEWIDKIRKMTPDVYETIQQRSKTQSVRSILKELNISATIYQRYKNKHVKKDK
jgi:hypothetical protein